MSGVRSFAYDLNTKRGIVRSRVILLLRSSEIKPSFYRSVHNIQFDMLTYLYQPFFLLYTSHSYVTIWRDAPLALRMNMALRSSISPLHSIQCNCKLYTIYFNTSSFQFLHQIYNWFIIDGYILFSSLYSMYTSLMCLFDLAKQLLICITIDAESFSSIGAPKYFSLVTLQYGSVFSSHSYVTIWSDFTLVTLQYDWVLHDSQLRYNMGILSLDELITWITYISFNSIVVFNLILQGANIDTVHYVYMYLKPIEMILC